MWPCTRIWGGVSVVMCRSEPLFSTSVCSSSGSVAMLFHGLPRDLFDRGHAIHHLHQPAAAQRDHALVDRLAAQFQRGGADQNQLAQLLGDLHHFVETDAALVAAVVAALAAAALLGDDLL